MKSLEFFKEKALKDLDFSWTLGAGTLDHSIHEQCF